MLIKSILVLLVLTAAPSSLDTDIQKKVFASGTTTLIFSNKDLSNVMKIVKPLEESCLPIKSVSETV